MENKGNAYVSKPSVAIVASCHPLVLALLENLEKNFCSVEIITDDKESLIKHLKISSEKIKSPNESLSPQINYVILLCLGSLAENFTRNFLLKEKEKIICAAKLSKKKSAKSLFVFPFVQEVSSHRVLSTWVSEILSDKKLFAGVIYLGEVLFKSQNFFYDFGLPGALKLFLSNRAIVIPRAERFFYPLESTLAVDEILRSLFSLRAYDKETAIVGDPISVKEFCEDLKKINPQTKIIYSKESQEIITPAVDEIIYKKTDLKNFLREEIKKHQLKEDLEFSSSTNGKTSSGPATLIKKTPFKFAKSPPHLKKTALSFLAAALFILVFPWFLIGISLYSLNCARSTFGKGELGPSEKALKISRASAVILKEYLLYTSKIPTIPILYKEPLESSYSLIKTTDAFLKVLSTTVDLIDLSEDTVGNNPYDVKIYQMRISLSLDALYKDFGFLQGESESLDGVSGRLAKRILKDFNVPDTKEKVWQYAKISMQLSELLGESKTKTYLVLFQESRTLRGAGGQVGAIGLVTFSGGLLTDYQVVGSAYADKRIRGQVEPPEIFRKYLGELNWFLRDSSWDADFSVASSKAEWFIDKELDRSVDGVVGIDTELLKSFLRETGPLYVEDREKVTADNLDDFLLKAQDSEGEIPEKEGLHSQIYTELFKRIFGVSPKDKVKLLRKILEGFNQKQLQIFSHEPIVQRAISNLGWGGEVNQMSCKGNCYSDFVGIVEANPKDSLESKFIKKEADLVVYLEKGLVKRKLILFFDNPNKGREEKYKSYVRVLVPDDSGFGPVDIVGEERKETTTPEVYGIRGHKEAGVFLELLPGETKALVFSWEGGTDVDFDKNGEYLFYLRKQAGAVPYPIEVRFGFPAEVLTLGIPSFSLTNQGLVGYNIILARDFLSRIFW